MPSGYNVGLMATQPIVTTERGFYPNAKNHLYKIFTKTQVFCKSSDPIRKGGSLSPVGKVGENFWSVPALLSVHLNQLLMTIYSGTL